MQRVVKRSHISYTILASLEPAREACDVAFCAYLSLGLPPFTYFQRRLIW